MSALEKLGAGFAPDKETEMKIRAELELKFQAEKKASDRHKLGKRRREQLEQEEKESLVGDTGNI